MGDDRWLDEDEEALRPFVEDVTDADVAAVLDGSSDEGPGEASDQEFGDPSIPKFSRMTDLEFSEYLERRSAEADAEAAGVGDAPTVGDMTDDDWHAVNNAPSASDIATAEGDQKIRLQIAHERALTLKQRISESMRAEAGISDTDTYEAAMASSDFAQMSAAEFDAFVRARSEGSLGLGIGDRALAEAFRKFSRGSD